MQTANQKQWGLALLVLAAGMWALINADAPRATVSASGTSQTPTTDHSLDRGQSVPAIQSEALPTKSVQRPTEPPENVDPVTGVIATGPTIVMVTQDGCGPCTQWWNQRDKWESQGWTVAKVDAADTAVQRTPTFRIFHRGEWRQHVGFMRPDDARTVLGMARKVVAKVVSAPLARGTYQGGREWSYPGDITSHMMGSNHGFSTAQLAGRSKAELERMHSQHHEGMRSAPTRQFSPVNAYSSGASCPGGNCPTSAQPRRGLFGRW